MSEHYQVIVIGPGSGGKEAAILTARAGLQVLLVGKVSLGGTMEQPKEFPLRALGRSFGKQYGQIRLARRDGKRKAGSASGQRSRHHLRHHALTFRILCLTMTSELVLMAKRA